MATQVPATPAIPFTVVSDIPACLEVVPKGTTSDANLLFATVGLKTTQITAACGCPSKWLLYRSVTSTQGIETELASGSLFAGEPDGAAIERRVVLLADREHPPAQALTVHVGCAPAP